MSLAKRVFFHEFNGISDNSSNGLSKHQLNKGQIIIIMALTGFDQWLPKYLEVKN